jgi:hypothetical protein
MIFDYVVILRNTSRRSIQLLNLFLAVIAIVYLAYRFAATPFLEVYTMAGLVIILLLLALLYAIKEKRKKPFATPGSFLFFAGLLILFNKQTQWVEVLFAFGLIVLSALEEKAKANLEIGFSTQFILFDNLLKKKYQWKDFNNIVLKDNLLTLDFKNNKIFQRETIDEESDCDEEEFNEFCKEQLRLARGE